MTKAPPLRDDCFAMPRGVNWTPVDQALAQLRDGLACVVEAKQVSITDALNGVLAKDAIAQFDHPPFMNSAVDGYGFCYADLPNTDEIALPLAQGRAAAGDGFDGDVPAGNALRILTGARVPSGVDTVILEEDVNASKTHIHFRGGLKFGANTRPQGEDVAKGNVVLKKGQKLRAQDLGLLASVGVGNVWIYERLKVAILTTGDELIDAGDPKSDSQIFDANRPMLRGLIESWGYIPVDVGIQPDDPIQIKQALDRASVDADVILTTGGASAGDEDHISKLLSEYGNMQTWRIAIKPGRPLALALWNRTPVFGLPGNPVAAMVCSIVFAGPACGVLSGQVWKAPAGVVVPAAFTKRKKAGRQEYLRARLNSEGAAEVFASEGSGRISGLSWADGLVRLDDPERDVKIGDLVNYLPF